MRFSKSVIPLKKGLVNSAAASAEGIGFLISDDGAIFKRILKKGARSVGEGKVMSLAENCVFAPGGYIERRGKKLNYILDT